MSITKFSRRNFLKMAGATSAGLSLEACGVKATRVKPTDLPIPTQTLVPTATLTFTPTPTPPTPTAAPTMTPSPTIEVKMADLPQTKAAVDQFAAAMQSAGLETNAEQIRQGLTTKEITGKDGGKYEIALTQDGYPLMIKIGGEWTSDTARTIFNSLGPKLGGMVDGSEEIHSSLYESAVKGNFDILFPASAYFYGNLKDHGLSEASYFTNLANRDGQTLYIHGGFYRGDQGYLEDIPLDQRTAKLQERAGEILKFVKPVDGNIQKLPTYVCIVNEPFSRYKNGDGEDTVGWKNESLAVKTLGKDILIESYLMFYNEAKAQGLELGKDVLFFYSEYGISSKNPKTDLALREFKRAKTEIARRLNIPIEEVQFALSLQQRYNETDPSTWPVDEWPTDSTGKVVPPLEKELDETTSEFKKLFNKIIFSEISDQGGTPEQQTYRFGALVRVAAKYSLEALVFEATLRFKVNKVDPISESKNTNLFTSSYAKGLQYFELTKIALKLIG